MSDGAFLGYIALLFASAVLLSVLAIRGFGQSTGARVIDGIFAAGFLVYAVYLLLFFEGGTVHILFYAFLVPVLAVVKMVKGRNAGRTGGGFPPAGYAPQTGYAQPGSPAPGYPPQGYAEAAQFGSPVRPGQSGLPAAGRHPGHAAPSGLPVPGQPPAGQSGVAPAPPVPW